MWTSSEGNGCSHVLHVAVVIVRRKAEIFVHVFINVAFTMSVLLLDSMR